MGFELSITSSVTVLLRCLFCIRLLWSGSWKLQSGKLVPKMAQILTQLFHSGQIWSWTCICTMVGTLAFHSFMCFGEGAGECEVVPASRAAGSGAATREDSTQMRTAVEVGGLIRSRTPFQSIVPPLQLLIYCARVTRGVCIMSLPDPADHLFESHVDVLSDPGSRSCWPRTVDATIKSQDARLCNPKQHRDRLSGRPHCSSIAANNLDSNR